jgi:hypothetical protein
VLSDAIGEQVECRRLISRDAISRKWKDMPDLNVMAPIAAALFVAYLLGIVYALIVPPKQHDPQRGMAVGCLMIVAIGIGVLLLLTGLGWYFQLNWLVTMMFYVAVFPAVLLLITGVRYLFRGGR